MYIAKIKDEQVAYAAQVKKACSKEEKKQKCLNNTYTLRHVLGSNPGGKFPLGIGSI